MAHPYDGHTSGMRRAVTSSLVIHAFILAALLFAGWPGQRQFIQDPVFVEIVSGARQVTAPIAKALPLQPQSEERHDKAKESKKAPLKAEAKRSAQKAAVKIPLKPGPKAELKDARKQADINAAKAGDAAKKVKERASVEEALKRVSEKVSKKEAAAAVESRIADIRRKDEAEKGALDKEIAEVRKGISQRPTAADSSRELRHAGSGQPTAIEARYPAYYSLIRDRVQAAWIYPEGFKADNVSIVISIKIGRSGRLIDSWVEKGSGNRNFDESLINAVRKASPFPPLPQDFSSVYLETGLRFCPLCKE